MAASIGAVLAPSSMKSPRWLSSSSPIGVSMEIGSLAIFMILRIFSSGFPSSRPGWSASGSKPNSCKCWRLMRFHLVDRLDHVHRNTDGARLVGDRAGNSLANPPGGVGRELVATAVFELVHRLHQADVAFLDQVEELQAAVGVLLGNRDHQAQVGLDHFLLGIAAEVASPSFMRLLMPLSSASGTTTRACRSISFCCRSCTGGMLRQHHGRPGLASGGLLLDPLQVQQVGRELLDERSPAACRTCPR